MSSVDEAYNRLVCPDRKCSWSPPRWAPGEDSGSGHGHVLRREERLLEYIAHLIETGHRTTPLLDGCLECWACHQMDVPSDCVRCSAEHATRHGRR